MKCKRKSSTQCASTGASKRNETKKCSSWVEPTPSSSSSCAHGVFVTSSFTASFFKSACVLTSLSPTWVSTSLFEVVCPSFLWARLASVEWSVTSCAPSRSSLFEPCFQKQGTSVSEVECCSLALPILFQRYLRCRPWSVKPFEKYSISVLWRHTINAISMYRSVGHDCKWLRLPKFQSLILRFWQSYPENCILARFPTSNIRHFLWKCVIIMTPFFLRVISKKIRWF